MNEHPTPPIFTLRDVIPVSPYSFPEPINLSMAKGEQWLMLGHNAAGKSMLTNVICGAYRLKQGEIQYNFEGSTERKAYRNIYRVTFQDQYGENTEAPFYQLRWNQGLIDDEIPSVTDVLMRALPDLQQTDERLTALRLDDLLDKKIIMLSSGEYRRFQIGKILLHNPRLLIIENPFIGLDAQNREQVAAYLNTVIAAGKTQVIMVACRMPANLSGFTHIVSLDNGYIVKCPISQYTETSLSVQLNHDLIRETFRTLRAAPVIATAGNEVLRLNNVSITYNSRRILDDINWQVSVGERWALEGRNGAGKSTLLSLICADNPQGYACDISLFGRRRGTGESIWDIKRHIGYVSPEMFRTYRKALPVKDIVASGLFDTIGLFRRPKASDYERIALWLRLFGIEHYQDTSFTQLSEGWQRMVLLARAFVKDPALLILDEPFHGLDDANRQLAMAIIEAYCARPDRTLIMVSHYAEDFPACITHHFQLVKPEL